MLRVIAQLPRLRLNLQSIDDNEPSWAKNGQEIVYRSRDILMAVSVDKGLPKSVGTPRLIVRGRYQVSAFEPPAYDVSGDGRRFLMIKGDQHSDQIHVVLNWFEELKRLVPTD